MICRCRPSCYNPGGRPLTGARIETASTTLASDVAPSQGRGSKLTGVGRAVAPSQGRGSKLRHAIGPADPASRRVAPSRGRGSKPIAVGARVAPTPTSPPHGGADRNMACSGLTAAQTAVAPSRGRGSKHPDGAAASSEIGRPLTGARIETKWGAARSQRTRRRPLTGARIETRRRIKHACPRSPPHGGADRNRDSTPTRLNQGRPLTGARIETGIAKPRPPRPGSPPHGGADRNASGQHVGTPARRRPLTGARIETD